MNQIQLVMQSNEKSFDEQYPPCDCRNGQYPPHFSDSKVNRNWIKSHLHLSQLNLIKAVVEMVKGKEIVKDDPTTFSNQIMHGEYAEGIVEGNRTTIESILQALTPLSTGDSKEK